MTEDTKRDVVYSTTHSAQIEDYPIGDIDRDPLFTSLLLKRVPIP
jgi:hypothetical protein